MKILIIDNYDSFTYNLYQYLTEIPGHEIEVIRNDRISTEEISRFDALVFSSGPGLPEAAGQMPAILKEYHHKIPMLGVCLGFYAMGEMYGVRLRNLEEVYHGVDTPLEVVEETGLFRGIPSGTRVGLYHSWTFSEETIPEDLVVTARDENGEVMAVRHVKDPVYGVQFHPESILTPVGKQILANFLYIAEINGKQ